MAQILCISKSEALLMTRMAMLEAAGHAPTPARDYREMLAACEGQSFAVAILGQTLSFNEKLKMSESLRQKCPGIRILELYTTDTPALKYPASRLQVSTAEPEELVRVVNALVARCEKPGKE